MKLHLTKRGERRMERAVELKREAVDVFKLVVMEWKSDPKSVQCFDLRIVDKAIKIHDELKELDPFYL